MVCRIQHYLSNVPYISYCLVGCKWNSQLVIPVEGRLILVNPNKKNRLEFYGRTEKDYNKILNRLDEVRKDTQQEDVTPRDPKYF